MTNFNVVLTIILLYFLNFSQQYQVFRVIDGTPTTITHFPVMAQLLLDAWGNQQYSQYCAGVIITSRHVLSTAHCFQLSMLNGRNYTNPKFWRIRVGSSYRTRGGEIHKVKSIHPHYGFHNYYYTDDIAVVVVTRPFVLGGSIRQATLPKLGSEIKANSLCILAGWGATEAAGAQSEQLQQTTMFTVDQQECFYRYNTIKAVITNSMMCAGKLDIGGADACFGDSGGPLIYKGFVVGLVSFGRGCGDSYYPGVYTKISHYSDWILKTVSTYK